MRIKDFFVEEVKDTVNTSDYSTDYDITYDNEVDVNVDSVNMDNLINDIYSENNLSDLSKSIFKVEELISSLPSEMPNDTKKATVLSILNSFGLNADMVISDGTDRLNMIVSARDKICEENTAIIENNDSIIDTKKHEIQSLETDNANKLDIISKSNVIATAEVNRINKLIEFIK